MNEKIEQGFMAFLAEGKEGIGGVRAVADDHIVVYIENGGEFKVARSAIRKVHDDKVILDPGKLDKALLSALGHTHDREDPKLLG
jgi:preprotein translocase subunit YajC